MPNSQSHLFSLAQLLESAEQRQSSMPPPPPAPPPEDDSGLIDILAMQARAREEASRPSSRTPLPVVSSTGVRPAGAARLAHTDPDLVAALTANAKRKQKHAMIGGVTAGIALILFAIGFASSAPAPSPPRMAAAVQSPAPVAPSLPPPPLVVAAPPPAAEAAPPATAEPVAANDADRTAKPKTKKKKKSSHASHPQHAAGPSLMKVISGGTAP